jgi:hypothetical protein
MSMKACLLLLLTLGCTVPCTDAAPVEDPLLSTAMVLCLRPLRLADQPQMGDAVETVKRLTTFSQSQTGNGKRAVEALIFIVRDLFLKEQEYASAQQAFNMADRQAVAKEQLADHTETVGSPLSGPNPRLAVIYRKQATDIRGKATKLRDDALALLKEKIVAYNVSVSYFQNQGYNEVVVVLASAIFAIVDRQLPDFEFKPTVSREWLSQQKRPQT